jgi:hypothetical protein
MLRASGNLSLPHLLSMEQHNLGMGTVNWSSRNREAHLTTGYRMLSGKRCAFGLPNQVHVNYAKTNIIWVLFTG